ncbi:MAG: DUF5106 domain-containing protein [Tannerella sp.]|jgi:hypothetical protein|nr:DUF5106 domain-containing protein [Tannerella sp.]
MKMHYRFLLFWIFVAGIAGCSSRKEEKKAENRVQETPAVPAMPKKFERVVPPVILVTYQERIDYMVTHYWDKFNFRDTMYCHAPDITEQAFVDFINLFPQTSSAVKIAEGVAKLLTSAEVESVMYGYFCTKAEHYLYDANSPMRNDDYYIPFLEHIVNSSKVVDIYKVRPRRQLELAYRNRPGTGAKNFTYTLASGKTGTLYGISAKYVVLMFYNPDCAECRRTTEMLKNSTVIASGVSSGNVKVLAVYPDENLEAWHKHTKDIPSAWINGYDGSLTVKNNEIYDLKAIPTLYLLDKNKKVILRDASIGDIQEHLEKNR